MISLPRWMGASVAVAVIALSPAQAAERGALPAGSYQVAQATDPGEYALQDEVRKLNGKVEELTFQLLQLEEKIRRMQEDNEFRFKELESKGGGQAQQQGDAGEAAAPSPPKVAEAMPAPAPAQKVARADSGSAARGEPPRNLGTLTIDGAGKVVDGTVDFSPGGINAAIDGEAVASVPATQDPETLYREGYKHVLDGDYNLAEGIFRSFAQTYPNDPLTPDARFWLAESLRAQGRLEDAAAAFVSVRKDYPQSLKAPETLLKIGQIMAELGDRDVACVTFADAEKSYPKMSGSVRERIRAERAKAKC